MAAVAAAVGAGAVTDGMDASVAKIEKAIAAWHDEIVELHDELIKNEKQYAIRHKIANKVRAAFQYTLSVIDERRHDPMIYPDHQKNKDEYDDAEWDMMTAECEEEDCRSACEEYNERICNARRKIQHLEFMLQYRYFPQHNVDSGLLYPHLRISDAVGGAQSLPTDAATSSIRAASPICHDNDYQYWQLRVIVPTETAQLYLCPWHNQECQCPLMLSDGHTHITCISCGAQFPICTLPQKCNWIFTQYGGVQYYSINSLDVWLHELRNPLEYFTPHNDTPLRMPTSEQEPIRYFYTILQSSNATVSCTQFNCPEFIQCAHIIGRAMYQFPIVADASVRQFFTLLLAPPSSERTTAIARVLSELTAICT
jgi:hypothetical protein